jgi:hypothetical protein
MTVKTVVSIHDLAHDRHPTSVFRALKKEGYAFKKMRSSSGQTLHVIDRRDADRFVAARTTDSYPIGGKRC